MKLSQFKANTIKKKLTFVNGEIVETIPERVFEGEVEFYELNLKKLQEINEKVVQDLKEEDSNELFLYKIIPFVTDVECDCTFDEFMDLMSAPTKEFISFLEALLVIVGELFDMLNELKDVQQSAKLVTEDITSKFKELPRTDEEVIEEVELE